MAVKQASLPPHSDSVSIINHSLRQSDARFCGIDKPFEVLGPDVFTPNYLYTILFMCEFYLGKQLEHWKEPVQRLENHKDATPNKGSATGVLLVLAHQLEHHKDATKITPGKTYNNKQTKFSL